jgi:DHA1 family multidrug resistance protein-like MFS transporter
MIGIILGSYGVSQFFLRIPLGFWSDRKKVFKPFILAGIGCCGLSCLVFALFPSPWVYLWARTLSGVGAAFWVIFTVFFASFFSHEESSKAMGQLVFCMSGAMLVSTIFGGWLAEHYGYRSPFWIGAIGALISFVSFMWIKEKKVEVETSRMTLKKLRQITASPELIAISLAGAGLYFNAFATTYGFVPILAVNLGSNKTQLGVLTALNFAAYSLASFFIGTKSLKLVTERFVVILAFLFIAMTSLALPLVGNLPVLFLNQIIHGTGRGIAYSILMGSVLRLVSSDERATAMGVFQSIYAFGIFTGPIVGGWVGSFWGVDGIFIISGVFTLMVIPLLWKMKISRRD